MTLTQIGVNSDNIKDVASALLSSRCNQQLDHFIHRTDEEAER
jgi:hypothetical protein